ncbi:hypothetical protein B0J13DRAFT_331446 [Dactylonectria estremocensis]|uniref:Succinate dehydrogenase cytochrome b subunit n=1 Tax=Dactylonectria estremocensis TaxID=1079267 RepID=A0A9P9ERY7_9HYPO|nr:hypothetical protein B0J13DRAFT_331446 [Dactylonectria estremocensis]
MIAQRVGVAALRRGAAKPFFSQTLPRAALAAGMSTTPIRPAPATNKLSLAEGEQVLVNQRLNRPISPHLGIYKIEQTWFGASAWTRITGCTLSGALYVYMASYVAAPLVGLHIESASVAAAFGSLPLFVKGGLKFALGFPFAFHFFSGLKHLYYDLGKGFAKSTVIKSEKILWGVSIFGGLALAFFV